jgi:hypothetical protein
MSPTSETSNDRPGEEGAVPDTDVRDSNPSGASPHGLEGDLGISSERTGPAGADPADEGVEGVEGTGSHGTAARGTDGVFDTSRAEVEPDAPREHPQQPAEGPDEGEGPDEQRSSPQDPAEGADDPDKVSDETSRASGVDRTVGEPKPDPVRKHEFDPTRNPGHSGA